MKGVLKQLAIRPFRQAHAFYFNEYGRPVRRMAQSEIYPPTFNGELRSHNRGVKHWPSERI